MKLWQIRGGRKNVCAGIVVEGERVTEAAPFFRWTIGLSWPWLVKPWLMRKGFHGSIVSRAPVAASPGTAGRAR